MDERRVTDEVNQPILTPDSVIFKMMVDDIRQIKEAQVRQGDENKEEFRRVHDKIDVLRDEVRRELKGHDKDIVRLTTQAQMAGKLSGAIWGASSSLVIGALIAVGRWLMTGT